MENIDLKRILVLYYSRSGNTEKMANSVTQGARSQGNVQVDLNYHIEADELSNYDAILLGTPTYNHEMPIDFKNLFNQVAQKSINLKGKIGSAFGSYG
jgi:NAD(P)H dehydrogenase (quinone)